MCSPSPPNRAEQSVRAAKKRGRKNRMKRSYADERAEDAAAHARVVATRRVDEEFVETETEEEGDSDDEGEDCFVEKLLDHVKEVAHADTEEP